MGFQVRRRLQHGGKHGGGGCVAGGRDVRQQGCNRPYHPDPLPAGFDHRTGGYQTAVDQRLQGRLARKVHVGREEGDGWRESGHEPGRELRAEVEVVVAQRHGVVQAAERDRVVQGALPVEGNVQLPGCQMVVPGGEGDHAVPGSLGLQLLHQGGEAGGAGVGGVLVCQQLRLAVVVVQDGEGEPAAVLGGLGARGGGRRRQPRRQREHRQRRRGPSPIPDCHAAPSIGTPDARMSGGACTGLFSSERLSRPHRRLAEG